MTQNQVQSIAIVGAGIAGLALAGFLARDGLSVSIFEKREQLETEGAGIQLTPNACHVLRCLGILEDVELRAHRVEHLAIHAGPSGKILNHLSVGEQFRTKFGAPYLVIHRQDLVEVLAQCAENFGAKLQFSKSIESFEKSGDIFGFCVDGEDHKADLVVGADGVWSNTRTAVNSCQARSTGRTAYRSIINLGKSRPSPVDDLSIWLGPNAHFVAYPISNGTQVNLVAITQNSENNERRPTDTTSSIVLTAFKDWAPEVQNLIQGADSWKSWPLYTVNPKADWSAGNVVLVGDAVHAMVPFLAQGGAAALEDAAALAHEIKTTPQADKALRNYESARKDRVDSIWHEALANGQRYHLPAPLAQARNFYLTSMPGDKLLSRYDWIYSWRPPQFNTQQH